MLELIFRGYIEWAYGIVLECWEYFSSALLDIMSMDFAYLTMRMPVIVPIMQSMLAVGWALLIGNLVFQASKSMMSGLGFEGEDPKLLFTRTFVFAFLLLASPQICKMCLDMTSTVIGIMEIPDAVNITFADEASFVGLASAWLLVAICGVIVMFQSFKLIFEMAERYFILAVLTITAPLAFGVGGSRNTSDIFSGWCRMYGSMCLLMVLNVVFVKMLFSVLSFYPSGLDVLPWMVLVLTVVKVAKKIDAIITRIGLNPAITGDSLGRTFPGALTYMVMRTMTSRVAKAAGKSTGGTGRGKSHGAPTYGGPGGPRSRGPFGGGGHAGTATATGGVAAYTEQNNAQKATSQSAVRQETQPKGASAQSVGHTGGQFTMEKEQSAGTTVSACSPINQGSTPGQPSRKSAVPPGTRRSPSHMKVVSGAAVGATLASRSAGPTKTKQPGSPAGQRPGVVPPQKVDAARPVSKARFTQVASHSVQGGAVSSTMQAEEQNRIAVGGAQISGAGPGTKVSPPGKAPGQVDSPAKTGAVPHREQAARSTHRDVRASRVSGVPGSSAAPASPARMQPGAAGTAGHEFRQSPPSELRHGRNVPPPTSTVSPGAGHSSPAAQEAVKALVPLGGLAERSAPVLRPGTAGTAPAAQQASQARQTARAQSKRAPSIPAATGAPGPKRTTSHSENAQKKLIPKKTPVKPPTRKRGGDRG